MLDITMGFLNAVITVSDVEYCEFEDNHSTPKEREVYEGLSIFDCEEKTLKKVEKIISEFDQMKADNEDLFDVYFCEESLGTELALYLSGHGISFSCRYDKPLGTELDKIAEKLLKKYRFEGFVEVDVETEKFSLNI